MTRHTRRRGAVAVEFALLAPVLAIVAMGIIDHGRYLRATTMVGNAARDAARTGSLVPLDTAVSPLAEAQGHRNLFDSELDGDVECEVLGFAPDQRVRCDVDVTLEPIFDLVPVPHTLTASVTMRMEAQP